jgi:hypothetical protein
MRRNRGKWITLAVIVLALLVGAYPIVRTRNLVFYPAGQEATTRFMH